VVTDGVVVGERVPEEVCAVEPTFDGFGLVAMRERVESLSGTLQVESEPGGGTAISACVPTLSASSVSGVLADS